MKQVLKLSPYRRLLAAYTLNEIAFSIGVLTLSVLVYNRTGSALGAMGFFLCSQFVPAFFAPLVVSRVEARQARVVLPALYSGEGVAYLILAWLARHFSLPAVLVLATVDATLAVSARSTARTATAAVLTPAGLLREGNALTNTAFSVCYFIGPALAGVIVASGGTSTALLVNAGLFAAISVTVALARGIPPPEPDSESRGRPVRAAIAHARTHPAIRRLFTLQSAMLLVFAVSIPVEVVFTRHTLHTGAGGYGALLSAWGAGAVAGSGAYVRWRSRPSRMLITVGGGLLGVGLALMAIAPSIVLACATALIAGAGNGIEVVAARTALQEEVPQRWMAMMMSLNESMYQAVPGAGILLGGLIASAAGARAALAVAGVGGLAVTVAVWTGLGRGQPPPGGEGADASQAEPPQTGPPGRPLDASVRTPCAAPA